MAAHINTHDRYTGFRFTKVKTMEGRDGEAYSAEITLNGRVVGFSRNDGNGGSDLRQFTDREAGEKFMERARAVYGDGFEVDDRLATNLVTVTVFNRKKATLFTTKAQGDFWDWDNPRSGEYSTLRGGGDLAGDVAWLKVNEPGCRVWVKDAGDFLPVESL